MRASRRLSALLGHSKQLNASRPAAQPSLRSFSSLNSPPSSSNSLATARPAVRQYHPSVPASSLSVAPASTSVSSAPPLGSFTYGYRPGPLTEAELDQYNRDGFIVKRSFYNAEEMRHLLTIAKSDRDINRHAIDVPDASGRASKLTVWNYLGDDDIYSMIGRGERMVGVMEQLLGDEVYHYHSKMMLKEPKVGGAWEWHQDFGYWYKNGVLQPRLASGLIAVDRATKANGCLQVLRGSHLYGRIEHNIAGGQTGADMEFVEAIAARCEKVHIECQAGDVLFFHCNLLHASAPNTSDYPRWSLICCYNARSNDPIRRSHHPNYHKLHRVPDSAIIQYGQQWLERRDRGENMEANEERKKAFLDPDDDETTPGSKRASAY